jgi:hypothetical protein
MYERNQQDTNRQMQNERIKSERIARELRMEAADQWQKAVTGMLALPTATALSMAATALQMAAFVERGFEIFQTQAEEVRRNLDGTRKSEATHRPEWATGSGEPELRQPPEPPRS